MITAEKLLERVPASANPDWDFSNPRTHVKRGTVFTVEVASEGHFFLVGDDGVCFSVRVMSDGRVFTTRLF